MFEIRDFPSKTISWWYNQFDKIDFEPSYQRKGRLWSTRDKSFLIDSILNGFDMPKIYLADFTFFNSELNEKKKPYAVIDGKQRLEAIFDFYSNKITLADDFTYYENMKLDLRGLSFKDLQAKFPKIASIFENYNVTVQAVITDNESMINEMFIRLNKSKPLTGAELRNAMQGEVPRIIYNIKDHIFFKEKVRFNVRRGQDSNVAGKLLLIEFRGKFVDTKRVHLDKLVEEGAEAEINSFSSYQEKINEVLTNMSNSFIDKDPLLSSSGLIPVYYWFYKKYAKKYLSQLRDFLVKFDNMRKTNRITQNPVADLFEFDILAKSLNDQKSLQGCFDILEENWLEQPSNKNLLKNE